jgi:UDP-glucose 4-epimerase
MENYKGSIEGKVILITGGTGSFGNAVVGELLNHNPKKVIVFSRDEKKQFDMGNAYASSLDKLKFVLGDIRDKDSINHALDGVNYIFHAAALKQVPNCEFFPLEAIRTNTLATHNVIDAAIENGVERVVVLSTDKAVYPINVMGMTKALMEKIMIAAAREKRGNTTFCGTRYGNVMNTRGSVIPYFIGLMKARKQLQITNGEMTRFMMSLQQSIDLVLYALTNGGNGDMYVRKAPAATVTDLATAMCNLFHYKQGIKEIGIRPGEKMYETLVSTEESYRAENCGDYYRINPEVPDMDYRSYFFKGEKKHVIPEVGYNSDNTQRLTVKEVESLLLTVPDIKAEVEAFAQTK